MQSDDNVFSFYIRASSAFLCVASIVLCWYSANIAIRKSSLHWLADFKRSVIEMDFRKLSTDGISGILNDNISNLCKIEDYRFELFGFAIPFFTIFLTISVLACSINISIILPILISIIIMTIVIKFANKMVSACDIRRYQIEFDEIVRSIAAAAKGIQYWDARRIIIDKFEDRKAVIFDETKKSIASVTWKMLAYLCLASCAAFALYIIDDDFAISGMFDISSDRSFFFPIIFFYTMFVVSILRYLKIRNIKLKTLDQYLLARDDTDTEKGPIKNGGGIFLAFHGVYFQDPTTLADGEPDDMKLQNLSFSVLPGESIAITGENMNYGEYIFELILKYYKSQSGNIYISGTSIDHIKTESIRSVIGFFKQDFALIDGTIYDNLAIIGIDDRRLFSIAEKLGLFPILEHQIFDHSTGKLNISQNILFKIQIARISIQNPKILLIESPETFESEDDENSFIEFVEHISKRKTVLIMTDYPKFLVYADKILYITDDDFIFGPHAQLSHDERYQLYIKGVKSLYGSK
ncbi:MAG: ATP-binding cassette domain-containing protein [Holosporales bacterium]|nr:ATP-binding cassette domain-containing protein [Holosporales bacterium]